MHKQVSIGNWRKSTSGKRGNVLPFRPGVLRYVFRDGAIAIALAESSGTRNQERTLNNFYASNYTFRYASKTYVK